MAQMEATPSRRPPAPLSLTVRIAHWISLTTLAMIVIIVTGLAGTIYVVVALVWPRFADLILAVAGVSLLLGAVATITTIRWPQHVISALLATLGLLVLAMGVGSGRLLALLALGALLAASFGLGDQAIAWLGLGDVDRPERLLLATGLGLGLLSLISLGLGLLGWLTFWPVIGLVGLANLLAFRRWRRSAAGSALTTLVRWRPSRGELVMVGIVSIALLFAVTWALAPEVESDSARMHLPIARLFATEGRVVAVRYLDVTYWPMLGQMLFSLATILVDVQAAKPIHTVAGLLSIVSSGLIVYRIAGRRAALATIGLVGTMPVLLWEMGTAYVDLFPVLYGLLALICLLGWSTSHRPGWLALLGLLLGCGLVAKLTFAFVLGTAGLIIGGLILERAWREHRWRRAAVELLVCGLGLLAIAGPWLLRSGLLTGQVPGLNLFVDAVARSDDARPESISNLPNFGIGRHPLGLLRLPWDLVLYSSRFGENPDGFIGFAPLALLPALLLLRSTVPVRLLASLVLLPLLLWFATAQYIRYLLPTLVMIIMLCSIGYGRLVEVTQQRFTQRQRQIVPWLHVALLILMLGGLAITLQTKTYEAPLRLMAGLEQPKEFQRRQQRMLPVLERLDQLVTPGQPVASMPEAWHLYTHAHLITVPLAEWLVRSQTDDELVAHLQRQQITYLVVDCRIIARDYLAAKLFEPAFLQRHGELVYSQHDVYLFRMHPVPSAHTAPFQAGQPTNFASDCAAGSAATKQNLSTTSQQP